MQGIPVQDNEADNDNPRFRKEQTMSADQPKSDTVRIDRRDVLLSALAVGAASDRRR